MAELKLDFNQRERARYAKQLRELAENATKAADALESNDDPEATVRFMIVSMAGSALSKDLGSALVDGLKAERDEVLDADRIEFRNL